jgi:hypothetical protein
MASSFPRSVLSPSVFLFLDIYVLHVQVAHFALSTYPSAQSFPLATTLK